MSTTIELGARRAELRKSWETLYATFPTKTMPDGSTAPDIPGDKIEELERIMTDLAEVGEQFEKAAKIEDFAKKNAQAMADEKKGVPIAHPPVSTPSAPQAPAFKSVSDFVLGSKEYKDMGATGLKMAGEMDFKDFDFGASYKTLMETTAGWAPESTRSGRVVMLNQRQPHVIDAIPIVPINQPASVYMRESTFTNNAAEVAEGGTYGEAALVLTQITEPVMKFTIWLPVTDEQLEDVDGIRAYLDNRLTLMIAQRVDTQIMNGDGVDPNINGFLQVSGISTIATGTDSAFTALLKAAVRVEVGGSGGDDLGWASPTAFMMHPLDWQNLVLSRTTDGQFVLGNPNDAMLRQQLFGLPVIRTTTTSQGTALTGDFRTFSAFRPYKGLRINMWDQHSDYAVKGKKAITATLRGTLDVYRNVAFCSITGLPA